MLAGFSVGSAWGGFIAERERATAASNVRTALVATAVLMALSPTLLAVIHGSGARGTGGMLVTVVLTFFPASVAVTLPSPFLAKLAVEARPGREGSSLGIVLSAGSVGAIFGAILAGFVTLPLIGSTATFAGCGTVALICLLFIRGSKAGDPPGGIIAGAVAFIAVTGIWGGSTCMYESGLSCIHVTEERGEVRMYSDRTLQAAEPLDGNGDLALSYTRWLWARMDADLGPAPSVLFIGGGGYTLPTKLLQSRPAAQAVAVEIDPLITRVVQRNLPNAAAMIERAGYKLTRAGPDVDARLGIVHADGRVYLNETDRRFDAAVLDAFSSGSVPAHLVTIETVERLREITDGPVYVNLIDRPDGPLARGVYAILGATYPFVVVEQGPVGATGRANILLAASHTPLETLDTGLDGYAPTAISPRARSPMTAAGSVTASR